MMKINGNEIENLKAGVELIAQSYTRGEHVDIELPDGQLQVRETVLETPFHSDDQIQVTFGQNVFTPDMIGFYGYLMCLNVYAAVVPGNQGLCDVFSYLLDYQLNGREITGLTVLTRVAGKDRADKYYVCIIDIENNQISKPELRVFRVGETLVETSIDEYSAELFQELDKQRMAVPTGKKPAALVVLSETSYLLSTSGNYDYPLSVKSPLFVKYPLFVKKVPFQLADFENGGVMV